MGLPQVGEARRFYRAAFQRFEDAEILLRNERRTGAFYLAGYGVECIMKALILSVAPVKDVPRVAKRLTHGRKAHRIEWLKRQYVERTRSSMPARLSPHLSRLNSWNTDLRYETRLMRVKETEVFLDSAREIIHWADDRM